MRRVFWCAAVVAVLSIPEGTLAQDVTLTSRDGGLVLPGMLQGYDGEFYRIETAYGLLTVDGQRVICAGPACPDLIVAFALSRGLDFRAALSPDGAAILTDPATGKTRAEMSFAAATP